MNDDSQPNVHYPNPKAGDIILEFDGKKIDTMRTLPKVVASTEVGKSV